MRGAVLAVVAIGLGGIVFGQPSNVDNARIVEETMVGDWEAALGSRIESQSEAAWLGYWVAKIAGRDGTCCYSDCCQGCHLERDPQASVSQSPPRVRLESGGRLLVLFRVEAGQFGRIGAFSEDCQLDLGGRTLFWLGDAEGDESVRFLFSKVDEAVGERVWQGALHAIAHHGGEAADAALRAAVAPDRPTAIRKQATFWMGAARGAAGLQTLKGLVQSDSSPKVRKQAVFAIHLSQAEGAESELIRLARRSSRSGIRREAIFWLAQKAGKRAVETLNEVIEDDPDVDVKVHAVFALSQLPRDEGVPQLIRVARSNKSAKVRKKAIFWLGQSGDSRALDFFEEVLTRPR